ncbi:PREDICTED: pancreatic secretory granule membrane major glycoprotein GP2-like [Acropora digitifera]|uniref:pancreatic secretory granule membrane major glycoprotein GP2-like n=1 Tax=Acropora digitifera TaxID=70779 RepID=UPI00077AF0A3|nr:PREDICTED: pancreatic secretory granule membrane major glycoprotein GP2-like [Acropora digitifera]
MSRHLCELNNRTKDARPEDYVQDPDRVYLTRPSERVPLGSIQEVPAASCQEIKASEGTSAVSGNYWLDSIKPGEVTLVSCDMRIGECKNYQILSSADRKVTYHTRTKLCDNTLGPGWFRFQGDAGTKMPTWCTPQDRCGSYGTGWLTGVHPQENEGTVTRKACFNYPYSCCRFSNNIKVRNCSGYYVYYLTRTTCSVRYCGTD